jgi:hypothetical protein
MGRTFERIRSALEDGRTVLSVHSAMRLRTRRIPFWQVIAASLEGQMLAEVPRARPNPKVELEILLADGTAAKAVWSWLGADDVAKLVTIHFFDE